MVWHCTLEIWLETPHPTHPLRGLALPCAACQIRNEELPIYLDFVERCVQVSVENVAAAAVGGAVGALPPGAIDGTASINEAADSFMKTLAG